MESVLLNALIFSTVTYLICLLISKNRTISVALNLVIMLVASFYIQELNGSILTLGELAQNLGNKLSHLGFYVSWLLALIISDNIIKRHRKSL